MELSHTSPMGHGAPHPPQLLTSVAVSTQSRSQQLKPASQAVMQSPQWASSDVRSVQLPLQSAKPPPQPDAPPAPPAPPDPPTSLPPDDGPPLEPPPLAP